MKISCGDFLAGGGGVTHAMGQIEELEVKFVLNHDPMAIRTNIFNHKKVKHYWADFYKQNEKEVDNVDFIWASIECTQHSRANGGKEKKIGSYTLAWEFIRYIKHINPFVIGIENVPEFKKWAPTNENNEPIKEREGEEFKKWKQTICNLGYDYHENINNAADYGLPTRRVRYFAFFTKKELNMDIKWPKQTHHKKGINGYKKWIACKSYIDLEDKGQSIFGRKYNPNVRKGKRKPLVENTLKRIAGGMKKEAPELYYIIQYYGNGINSQSIESPLNTITTKDRHLLVNFEKKQFVTDHVHQDISGSIDNPISPILTREEKRLVTVENECQFLQDYYTRDNTAHSLNGPANTITTQNSKHLITSRFISHQYTNYGKPEKSNQSINEPLNTIIAVEKAQFVTTYLSVDKNEDDIKNAILNGNFDFDIKVRFLHPEELSQISTFPKKYFTHPLLKLTRKDQVKLIGNAVPPKWAQMMIEPVIKELKEKLNK